MRDRLQREDPDHQFLLREQPEDEWQIVRLNLRAMTSRHLRAERGEASAPRGRASFSYPADPAVRPSVGLTRQTQASLRHAAERTRCCRQLDGNRATSSLRSSGLTTIHQSTPHGHV